MKNECKKMQEIENEYKEEENKNNEIKTKKIRIKFSLRRLCSNTSGGYHC